MSTRRWRRNTREQSSGEGEAITRRSPGIAALFEGLGAARTDLSVLDLARATDAALRIYTRNAARWVRFASVVGDRICDAGALAKLTDTPEPPYDLLFAWDLFDRVLPHERGAIARHLAAVCAPNARLHMLVSMFEGGEPLASFRYSLLDEHHMRCEPLPFRSSGRPCVQPAEVERLLVPFRVAKGFVLRPSLREYVAEYPAGSAYDTPAR